jgi:hypothetical protein
LFGISVKIDSLDVRNVILLARGCLCDSVSEGRRLAGVCWLTSLSFAFPYLGFDSVWWNLIAKRKLSKKKSNLKSSKRETNPEVILLSINFTILISDSPALNKTLSCLSTMKFENL